MMIEAALIAAGIIGIGLLAGRDLDRAGSVMRHRPDRRLRCQGRFPEGDMLDRGVRARSRPLHWSDIDAGGGRPDRRRGLSWFPANIRRTSRRRHCLHLQ